MKSAVLGFTGLVGSHIQEMGFGHIGISRANISLLAGEPFDTLYISAMPAEKWKANKEPQEDLENLLRLQSSLSSARASNVVLISTVDVFSNPSAVDEDAEPTPQQANSYGKHRLMLENFVRENFAEVRIVRLPGLLSPRLKKNLIFDLRNGNSTTGVAINSVFQFYPLKRLAGDLEVIQKQAPGVYHLTSEPLPVSRLAAELYLEPSSFAPHSAAAPNYDFRTKFASLWNVLGNYQVTMDEALSEIKAYLRAGAPK